MNNNKGITLIALVITIIVLLILAGVTIATLTGDNGLLSKAGQAKNTSEKAGEKERIQMEVAGAYDTRGRLDATKIVENIEKNIGATAEATSNSFPVKVTYNNGHKYQVESDGSIMISVNAGDTAPSDSNAVYSSGDFTAIIPAGFTVSDKTGESSIENGLVVRDGSKNEWVWIPVSPEELALMYTENNTGWKMLGTTLPEVFTKYKTLGTTLGSRTDPGTTADPYYREPDVLSSYDTNADYRKAAGFVEADGTTASSLETMATKLKDDYKDMIESVKKNGGFYIGRYEIGKNTSDNNKPQVKAGAVVMNNTNWYNLYKACKSFTSGNVESRMIWGCQWDQVCRFISTLGDNKVSSLDNSKSYGNYNNSEGAAATNSGSSNFDSTTGRNSAWKTNNIYDLAGNCWEWTQEAYSTFNRARRGR